MEQKKKYLEDERIIAAFLNNFRMVDVIRESKLSKKTAYKIRNDPDFQKVLRSRKDDIIKTAVNKMQGYLVKDVEILQGIIEDEETAPQIKVNAIKVLLDQLKDWTNTTELVERLVILEETSRNEITTL